MAANWLHGWIQVIQVIGCDWFLPESAEMGDNDSWIWSNGFHKVDSDLSRHSPSFSLSSRHSQTFSSHHSPSFSSRIIHRLSPLASFTDFLLSHRSPTFSARIIHHLSPIVIHFLLSHRSPTFSSRIVHRLSPLASFTHSSHIIYRLSRIIHRIPPLSFTKFLLSHHSPMFSCHHPHTFIHTLSTNGLVFVSYLFASKFHGLGISFRLFNSNLFI